MTHHYPDGEPPLEPWWNEFIPVTRAELNRRLAGIESHLSALEVIQTQIGERQVALQDDINAVAAALADENSQLNTAVAGIQAELADLEQQIANGQQVDLSGLQAQVDAMKSAVDAAAALVPAPPADGS